VVGDVVVTHPAEGVVVVADGVHAAQEPLLEVEPGLPRSPGGGELPDPGEEVGGPAGVHVRLRRHTPDGDAGAQLLHRAHHRAVVLQHRVDEGRQVVAVGEPVVEAVALHLSLQVLVRDVETVLVPVAGPLPRILEGQLVLAHGVVAWHPGQVLHAEAPLPETAHLPDALLLARRAAVQLLDQAPVLRIPVHLGQVGLLVEIEQLRVLRCGRPAIPL